MFDFIIKNGFVVDGSGYPGLKQDVAIKGGRIAAVALHIPEEQGRRVIDAEGLVVCPGFIDAHSHADRTLPYNRKAESAIRQGITTVVAGQCGGSAAPLNTEMKERFKRRGREIPWNTMAEYLGCLEEGGIGVNLAMLVGQGTVRGYVMGDERREPTAEELDEMRALVRQAMEEGAWGISTGRRYPPGCYASEAEVTELCQVAAQYGGIYMSHIYNQDARILESIQDLIEVGRETGMKVQLVHQKVCGKVNWGRAADTLELMERARAEGIDILSDQYPYRFTQISSMNGLFPRWAVVGEVSDVLQRLNDAEQREQIIAFMQETAQRDPVRHESVRQTGVLWCKHTKEVEGMSYAEIADLWGMDIFAMWIKLYQENEGHVKTAGIMSEEDIRTILRHPYVMVGTDSFVIDGIPADTSTMHLRNFGTYPYILQHYVRENTVLTLEEAIYKMTGMPARRMGFQDRGLLQPGMAADVVVFDLNTVADNATIEEPCRYPAGIEYVWVNGELTLERGTYHECYAGKVLKRS